MPTVLAIETSCDETGVAVVTKEGNNICILSNAVASQIDIHAVTGGVIPEVAAREHVQIIGPMIDKAVNEAGINIDAIAVTVGPGLMPALAVGVQAARTLGFAWNKPIVPVHHIEGHIYSALLRSDGEFSNANFQFSNKEKNGKSKEPNLPPITYNLPTNSFPALALIVSGGHTLLIQITNDLQYEIIGTTRDDAAGEAFDKVARLLKLPYPGGPQVNKLAEKGNATAYPFPRPMLESPDFDFSFSGLKTAVLYTVRDNPKANHADIAASFQAAVITTLVEKTRRAIRAYHPKAVLLAGGVAANKRLRQEITHMANQESISLQIAPPELCGDNAAMIGQVGTLAFEAGRTKSWSDIDATARIPIENFSLVNPSTN